MKIIITMAGEGSRFKNAGYNVPKHEIIFKGKTLFEWAITSLSNFFEYEFIFIVRSTHNKEKLNELINKTSISKYSICAIAELTSGQGETVYKYTSNQANDEPILIWNIDTFVNPKSISPNEIKGKQWWLTANMPGEKWSFVKINNDGTFDVSEKIKISDNASLGMYYFHSLKHFNYVFKKHRSDVIEMWHETYVAPFSKYYAHEISVHKIESSNIAILGTPEDLNIELSRGNSPLLNNV